MTEPDNFTVAWYDKDNQSISTPTGVTTSYSKETDKFTINTTAETLAGTYKFTLTSGGVTSEKATLKINDPNIVITGKEATNPTDYSSTNYVGVDGKKTEIAENEINSIKTVEGGVAETVYGIKKSDTSTLRIDSLTGGIDVKSSKGKAYGVSAENNSNLTLNSLGDISVTASSTAYGIFSKYSNLTVNCSGDISVESSGTSYAYGISSLGANSIITLTSTNNSMNISVSATDDAKAYSVCSSNSGKIVLGEKGKTVNLTGNVYTTANATLDLAGTTEVVTGNVDNSGTLNLTGTMKVDSGTLTNTGTIVVDMSFVDSNNKPKSVTLIDCEGTASYGTAGTNYKFADGKDKGYVLVVVGNDLVAKTAQTLTFTGVTNDAVTKAYGDAKFTQAVSGANTTVTYSSSDSSIASVNSTTGEVTINKVGEVTITAKAAATSDYAAAEKTYTLTVDKAKVTVPTAVTGLIYNGSSQTGVTLPQNAKYTLSGNTGTNASDSYSATATLTDTANYEWNLTTPTSDNQSISWSIAKKEIKITADDKSSRVGSDLVTLTYTRDTNTTLCGSDTLTGDLATNANKTTAGTYNITQGGLTAGNNYTINFTAGTYTVTAKDSQTLTFADSSITKTYGDAKFTQKVSGANTTVTYSSSDTNVATVNSSTGEVTIVGSGTATITATAAEDTTYASASKSYTLVVRPKANSDKSNVTINGNKLSASLTKGSTSDRNIDFDMSIANDTTVGHVNLVKNQDDTYSNTDGTNTRIQITSGQNTIDPSNYVIASGSIKISLKKAYLDTLAAGTHDYQISIKDNADITYTYDLSITINNPTSSSDTTYKVVKTGVEGTNASPTKLVSLLSLVTIAGIVTLKKRKH